MLDIPPSQNASTLTQVEDFRPGERGYFGFRMFSELGISASSQFSARGLKDIKAKIEAEHPGRRILVIDLREESHGLTREDRPVSWRRAGDHNWANRGRSDAAMIADEARRLRAIGGKSEAEACRELGLDYLRLRVTDHMRPDDRTVEQMIAIARRAAEDGTWIHVHCRAGKGRTTQFLALQALLMRGRGGPSVEEIVQRLSATGGSDLFRPPQEDDYAAAFHVERARLIRELDRYSRATRGLTPWTEWLAAKGPRKAA